MMSSTTGAAARTAIAHGDFMYLAAVNASVATVRGPADPVRPHHDGRPCRAARLRCHGTDRDPRRRCQSQRRTCRAFAPASPPEPHPAALRQPRRWLHSPRRGHRLHPRQRLHRRAQRHRRRRCQVFHRRIQCDRRGWHCPWRFPQPGCQPLCCRLAPRCWRLRRSWRKPFRQALHLGWPLLRTLRSLGTVGPRACPSGTGCCTS
mmetsp:Transcript_21891/g.55661  ORF Transcript_21891/g.55661 Transcript_21891/m.55661 type:complete len:205 (-) Transcript_21891:863-1477(-)